MVGGSHILVFPVTFFFFFCLMNYMKVFQSSNQLTLRRLPSIISLGSDPIWVK